MWIRTKKLSSRLLQRQTAVLSLCCVIFFAQIQAASHFHDDELESHSECGVCHHVNDDEEYFLPSYDFLVVRSNFGKKSEGTTLGFNTPILDVRSRAPPFI